MAELTPRVAGEDATAIELDGHDRHDDQAPTLVASDIVASGVEHPATDDPHAVRVRLGPPSMLGDEPPVRVAPAAAPLRMTNPTVGRGPLGGAAIPDAPDGDPVLAQRHVMVDGEQTDARLTAVGHERYVLDVAGARTRLVLGPIHRLAGGISRREVIVDGFRFEVDVEGERIAALRERATRGRAASAHSGPLDVRAIIPGKVASVSVAPGDAVTAGQQLLVVEAMKMQNELRAPRDGTIDRVGVAPGDNIEVGDLLVVIT